MYIAGIAIMHLALLLVCWMKHVPWSMLVNWPIITIVLLTIIGVIIATGSFRTFIRGCNAVLSAKYFIHDEDRQKAAALFRLLSKAVILMSITCIFTGVISALSNMDDKELIVHGLAAALIGPLVGIFVAVTFFETAAGVLGKPRGASETAKESPARGKQAPGAEFCTCDDFACPHHPRNSGSGCTACIEKNLKCLEIPSCFFNNIGKEPEASSEWTYKEFAKKVMER